MGFILKTEFCKGLILSNIARPLPGLANLWPTILVLRSMDRIGKGLRSAPRDALIADTTPAHIRGYAFGFHRTLDNSGAVAGSLAAAALTWSDLSLSEVILWSAVPGCIAVLLMGIGIQEEKTTIVQNAPVLPPLNWLALSLPMQRYLLVLMLFTFARASETFILLLGAPIRYQCSRTATIMVSTQFCQSHHRHLRRTPSRSFRTGHAHIDWMDSLRMPIPIIQQRQRIR
ncbi:hypothetical protein SAMN05216419_10643 [Nitrosomonas cryotolerans]|nr:hypothetical protein SAMN05216419_10643 [Nitrosomonas cryotolerans]